MANADTLDGAGVNSGNALDAAKIQLNSETMKFYTDKYPILGGLHQVTVHAPWPPSPHANYFSNKKKLRNKGITMLHRPFRATPN